MKKAVSIMWKAIDWFLFFATVAMVLLIFINVIGRYVFNFAFVSFEEISRILFVWCTYLGSAIAIKEGTHVRVDIVINALKPKARKIVDIIANLIVSFILAVTIVTMKDLIAINIANPLPLTKIPYGVVQLIIPIGMFIMLCVNVYNLVMMLTGRPTTVEMLQDQGKEETE